MKVAKFVDSLVPVEPVSRSKVSFLNAALAAIYDFFYRWAMFTLWLYTVVRENFRRLEKQFPILEKARNAVFSMLPKKPNDYNAQMVCAMRYTLTFVQPPFQTDPNEREYSIAFLSMYYRVLLALLRRLQPHQVLYRRPWLGYMGLRTNLIDRLLIEIVKKHAMKQVVFLGAGFDCRFYRFRKEMLNMPHGQVKMIEVDQPDVQQRKLELLSRHLGSVKFEETTKFVHYLGCNFEKESVADVLLRCNAFEQGVPTLYIWEGVVWYLTEAAVQQTLAALQKLSASKKDGAPCESQIIIETPSAESVHEASNAMDLLVMRWMKTRHRDAQFGFSYDDKKCNEYLKRFDFELVRGWDLFDMLKELNEEQLPTLKRGVVGLRILQVRSLSA